MSKRQQRHGHKPASAPTPTYNTWNSMKRRCDNPTCPEYPRYGGRGITYSEEWGSFPAFLRDMGERPKGLTLDRINNDLGYSKENCRWATPRQQGQNTCKTVLYTLNGVSLCISEWARRIGVNHNTVKRRIKVGWPLERALTAPAVPPTESVKFAHEGTRRKHAHKSEVNRGL